MTEATVFQGLTWAWILLAPAVFVALLFITVPYGRYHQGRSWGAPFSGVVGWIVMELPAVVTMPLVFFLSGRAPGPVEAAFLVLWEAHYLHRTFLFPLRRKAYLEPVPVVVALLGVLFNIANGYLNGRWLGHFSPGYPTAWLWDPRFLAGAVLFALGMTINIHSDEVILDLRRAGGGYQVPQRGVHRRVASPNYADGAPRRGLSGPTPSRHTFVPAAPWGWKTPGWGLDTPVAVGAWGEFVRDSRQEYLWNHGT